MTETQREYVWWALLVCLVYFAGYLAELAAATVLSWLVTCVLQVARTVTMSRLPSVLLLYALGLAILAARFAAAGFVYCWLIDDDWRKSGLSAWVLLEAVLNAEAIYAHGVPIPGSLVAAALFCAVAGVACAAALAGARCADENREHPNLVAVKELLFRF